MSQDKDSAISVDVIVVVGAAASLKETGLV